MASLQKASFGAEGEVWHKQSMDDDVDTGFTIKVLHLGQAFTHTLPNWPIFSVDLRVMKFTFDDEKNYHGLIRDDSNLLNLPRPFDLRLHDQNCFVKNEVDEFTCINLKDSLLLPEGILIVWDWDDYPMDPEEDKQDEFSDFESDIKEESEVTHTITFKCIGTTKEAGYQELLRSISQLPFKDIEVKLCPEPDNCYDSKAIAFMVNFDGKERRIGYVIRELLDEVHHCITYHEIKKVQFAWIKYIVEWPRCGPGYFCGIDITKKGQWSNNAIKFQSTR